MKNETLSDIIKNMKDFGDGAYDTLIKAPFAMGDFIARATGIRDIQFNTGDYYRMQTKNEINTILIALGNQETAKIIGKSLAKELKERPLYFVGGLITGKYSPFDAMTLTTAKIDAKVNELINQEGFKELYNLFDKLGENNKFDVLGNSWDEILDFYGNYDDVFEYYKNISASQIFQDTKDYFSAWKDLFAEFTDKFKDFIDNSQTKEEEKLKTTTHNKNLENKTNFDFCPELTLAVSKMPKIHSQITSHDSSHETKLTSDEIKAIRKNCQKNGVLDLSKFKDISFCFLSLKEFYLKSGDENGFHERFEHFKNMGSLTKDKNAHEKYKNIQENGENQNLTQNNQNKFKP